MDLLRQRETPDTAFGHYYRDRICQSYSIGNAEENRQ